MLARAGQLATTAGACAPWWRAGPHGRFLLHSRAIDVLVICTGNICRSPMGEALLRHHLETRGVAARVHSAGTMRWNGPATDEAVDALRDYGLDLSPHRSRSLTPGLVDATDLVLGMTRTHVDFVTTRCPDAAGKTFMVRELARLGRVVGPRAAGEPVAAWLARVATLREPGRPVGHPQDEIDDPVGEPVEVYRRTAALLDASLTTVAELLAGTEQRGIEQTGVA
ncbi:MAG TPA: protein-tyrosine-phosphatase [Acidimicrobiia bacterium]|nr:protein-tyrosine-phosphatase [Acidimicrobiia bacterium]